MLALEHGFVHFWPWRCWPVGALWLAPRLVGRPVLALVLILGAHAGYALTGVKPKLALVALLPVWVLVTVAL